MKDTFYTIRRIETREWEKYVTLEIHVLQSCRWNPFDPERETGCNLDSAIRMKWQGHYRGSEGKPSEWMASTGIRSTWSTLMCSSIMSATKYMIWFRDRDPETQEWRWGTTGEGPFSKKTAERIAKEFGMSFTFNPRSGWWESVG